MQSTISSKGQVTIPKAARHELGLDPGTVIRFHIEDGRLIAIKVQPTDPVTEVYGLLADGRRTDDIVRTLRDPE